VPLPATEGGVIQNHPIRAPSPQTKKEDSKVEMKGEEMKIHRK
jgi:hypothetical protein